MLVFVFTHGLTDEILIERTVCSISNSYSMCKFFTQSVPSSLNALSKSHREHVTCAYDLSKLRIFKIISSELFWTSISWQTLSRHHLQLHVYSLLFDLFVLLLLSFYEDLHSLYLYNIWFLSHSVIATICHIV